MFDVIVVGTDGSDTATLALTKAIELAEKFAATLHVVHAHRLVSTSALAQTASAGGPTFDIGEVNRGIEEDSRQVCVRAAEQATAAG
jgi:nucleotide-binding universal stress UspA family protein